MVLSREQAVIVDHERAQTYGTKYLARIQGELFARGLKLTAAMDKFNEFLKLPPGDSRAGAIWDFAFGLLSTFVPALRIGTFVQKQHEKATVALALAMQAGNKAKVARAVKRGTGAAIKAGKAAEKANDVKDKASKIAENAGKVTKESESGESQLAKLDASRKPINDLIQSGDKARESWEKALDAELAEFENRLGGVAATQPGSLEDYMHGLLEPLPQTYSVSELDEIELLYLWYMITSYAKANVTISTLTEVSRSGPSRVWRQSIKGLNDTQKQTILDLFGDKAKRGKIYFRPPVVKNVYKFLKDAGSVESHETFSGDWDGHRGMKF